MESILVVDDSATARMVIKRNLEMMGFAECEILEAAHGKEALSAMAKKLPDLVLSDIHMPQMDGLLFLKWVKGNKKLASVPIIFVTSGGNPAREQELLDVGAVAVLRKPLSPEALFPVLESIGVA